MQPRVPLLLEACPKPRADPPLGHQRSTITEGSKVGRVLDRLLAAPIGLESGYRDCVSTGTPFCGQHFVSMLSSCTHWSQPRDRSHQCGIWVNMNSTSKKHIEAILKSFRDGTGSRQSFAGVGLNLSHPGNSLRSRSSFHQLFPEAPVAPAVSSLRRAS